MGAIRRVGTTLAALASLQLCMAQLAGPAGAGSASSPSHLAATGSGSVGGWGHAEELPGTATSNATGLAAVSSVSCTSAGDCAAGGYVDDRLNRLQAFVANEVKGVWGSAEEVPGSGALNAGGTAAVNSVSCRFARSCAAGGYYTDRAGGLEAFVVDDVKGAWQGAEEVPGTSALNAGGGAEVNSLSCPSIGNCSAGGFYTDAAGAVQAFLADEVYGSWRTAEEVPGTATLNAGGSATVTSVSCTSAGDCAAVGSYEDSSGHYQAFVVTEVKGTWGIATELPGVASLNAGGNADAYDVSCASAGNCSAGGYYTDGAGGLQAFVDEETGGTWGTAEELPGTATLNAGASAAVDSLACTSSGNCVAGGYYADSSGNLQAFVVDEVDGTWQEAVEVPRTAKLNAGGYAFVSSVSCSSAGNCVAGGGYWSSFLVQQAFVVNEVNGTWHNAKEVPRSGKLNAGGNAEVDSVSCNPAGYCVGGGDYTDISFDYQAFVAGYAPTPAVTRVLPMTGPASGGTMVTIIGRDLVAPEAVRFGPEKARIRKVVSATRIVVVSPKGSGTVDVTVTTGGGTSAQAAADRFSY